MQNNEPKRDDIKPDFDGLVKEVEEQMAFWVLLYYSTEKIMILPNDHP